MPKKKVSDFEYLNYLKEQYDFLTSDIKQYESGKRHFGIKIAATLRTIFHNTQQSKSILPYLTDKHGLKLVFRKKGNDFSKDPRVSMYIDFVIGKIKLNHDYFNAPFYKDTDFETYWNDLVYRSGCILYTRKQMILFAANKLGGSHVDPEIPTKLLKIVGSSAPKLISEAYGESTIINCVAYQTSIQVSNNLEIVIPALEERICQ